MRFSTLLDIAMLFLAFLDVAVFYDDISRGEIPVAFIVILLLITVGYFIALNALNRRMKNILRRIAEEMGCKFSDEGWLHYRIVCQNMEIEGTLRSTYMPQSLHLTFKAHFKDAVFRGRDVSSQRFTDKLLDVALKYGVRVNDAYASSSVVELLLTRLPESEKKLRELIREYRRLFTSLME